MGQRLVDIGNRRVAQQIISLVVTGGIGPGEAGDRSGVVRAESAAGLEDEAALVLPSAAIQRKVMDVSPSLRS